ncbi:hypothetical protein ACS0TY_023972 [Phlomoides rotata]
MKPELVVNLTEDEISTRRAWGVWVYLTEMDKVKYPFKIYQNLGNDLGKQVDRDREHPAKGMQHDVCRKMARTHLPILCHTREAVVRKKFSSKEGLTRKRILVEERDKFSGEQTRPSKSVRRKLQ